MLFSRIQNKKIHPKGGFASPAPPGGGVFEPVEWGRKKWCPA